MTSIKQVQSRYRLAYNNEGHDCSVRALAVVCAVPYDSAWLAMRAVGRRSGQAATMGMIDIAARSLGFMLSEVKTESKTLRTLCVELENEPGAFMAVTTDHVAGFWQGECIDWCRDRPLRLQYLLAVLRIK